jgi:hypothetical protein
MPSTTRFRSFPGALAKKIHNLSADSIYLMLTNVAPVISNTVKANLTEIAAGGGYAANGFPLTRLSFDDGASTGIWRLFLQDYTFTPSGAVGTWQYAAIYNFTATNKELICWADYGVPIALSGSADPFTYQFDQVNGLLWGS